MCRVAGEAHLCSAAQSAPAACTAVHAGTLPWKLFTSSPLQSAVGLESVAMTLPPRPCSNAAQYPTPAPTSRRGPSASRALRATSFGAAKAYRWQGHERAQSRYACKIRHKICAPYAPHAHVQHLSRGSANGASSGHGAGALRAVRAPAGRCMRAAVAAHRQLASCPPLTASSRCGRCHHLALQSSRARLALHTTNDTRMHPAAHERRARVQIAPK